MFGRGWPWWLFLVVLLPAWWGAIAAEPASAVPTSRQAYLVFEQSCADCHGAHLAKPKGKFGHVLDLRRLVTDEQIVPGDPDASDLFLSMISTDEEELMPPPDSDAIKPSAEQIEQIRAWIAAGAVIEEVSEPPPGGDAAPAVAKPVARRSLGQIVGRFHPVLVHFPIALVLMACVTEIVSRLRPTTAGWTQGATRASLWGAVGGGILAVVCGWLHARYEGYADGAVFVHRWLGVASAGLAAIAFAVSEWTERKHGSRRLLLVVLIVGAAVVALAGHTGGMLTYGDDYFSW